jgi:DNA-binding transcriptional LysR family regulator
MVMALPEIRLMQGAIALAEELNFSRASERLHISQPTLSKQIVELESQLGFRLFHRNHQMVDLTDAGRAFVEEAREAVLHAQRAVSASKAIFSRADEILNIGKSPLGDPFLVSLLYSIRLPLFPGLKIRLTSHYATDLEQQVLTGALDLALVAFVPDHPKLSLLRIAETPVYVAISMEDEPAVHREIHMEDIHSRNWIVHG